MKLCHHASGLVGKDFSSHSCCKGQILRPVQMQLFLSVIWAVMNCRWWDEKNIFLNLFDINMSENKLQRQRQILCTRGTSLRFLPLLFTSLDLSFHWLKIAHPVPPSIFPRVQNNQPEVLRPFKWLILTLHRERCTANYTEQSILNKYRLVRQIFSVCICFSPCCGSVFTLRKCLSR